MYRKPQTLEEYRVAYERVVDKLGEAQAVMVDCPRCNPQYIGIQNEKAVVSAAGRRLAASVARGRLAADVARGKRA